MTPTVPIERIEAAAFRVPTDFPESDGTFEWSSTTMVLVRAHAAGEVGYGWTYSGAAAARLIRDSLAEVVCGRDATAIPAAWTAMAQAVRNLGRPGLCSSAIAAVDVALWDLKARLLGLPLVRLLGACREEAEIYGSGGFTSYPPDRLATQLGGWAALGIRQVKMKIGREPDADIDRVRIARDAIGPEVGLMVDANGAYDRKQALAKAYAFADLGVIWFEEPVSSDDLAGLRLLRDRLPAGMEVAAGEYGYDGDYFHRMLTAGAVDVLQADATRCAGITGFLQAATLADRFHLPISAHTAPALHLHPCCAVPNFRHIEYFHDHARIEAMFFDGVAAPEGGGLRPDPDRPGLGLTFREADAAHYAV